MLKAKFEHLSIGGILVIGFCWDKGGDGRAVPGLEEYGKHK